MRESLLANHLTEQGNSLVHLLPGAAIGEVTQMRRDAFARLAITGLPRMTDEQWRYTNIRSLERITFDFSRDAGNSVSVLDLEKIRLQKSDMFRVVLVDGWVSQELSQLEGLPDSVSVCSLAEILESGNSIDSKSYDFAMEQLQRKSLEAENGFAALGAGFAADGIAVHVSAGTVLEIPLEILCVSRNDAGTRFCNINSFIHVEKGARLQVVERYGSLGDTNHMTNSAITFKLDEDAQVDHYRIQNESESAFHIGSAKINQESGSRYRIYSLSFGALLNRHEVMQSLDGAQSHCELKGLYIGQGSQHIDNYTTILHASPDATSEEFYKGVLDDRARSVFHGRIKVAPGAQHTDAQQQNRNLLLSPNAEADTKPQLEIYADDVKCSHGATVGQLDENAVFYLRSRGLGEDEARAVLTRAFVTEIVDEIELESVREQVLDLVKNKLNFEFNVKEAA